MFKEFNATSGYLIKTLGCITIVNSISVHVFTCIDIGHKRLRLTKRKYVHWTETKVLNLVRKLVGGTGFT